MVREQAGHRIEAEVDAPPRVEIQGPADRLELATPRPIEVGYTASDDFGLGVIELVYRVGDRPVQRILLRDGHGVRAAQGAPSSTPARAPSSPGSASGITSRRAIATTSRAARTASRARRARSTCIIQNPHESLEDRLERQRELLEKLIGDLADRIEKGGAARARARP